MCNLLVIEKWKEVDKEIDNCILKVVRWEKKGWLRVEDIDDFFGEDLDIINKFWVKYSNVKFGFFV